MRTTIDLDDKLVADAQRYSGISERSELLREALRALIPERDVPTDGPARRQRSDSQSRAASTLRSVIVIDTSVWIDTCERPTRRSSRSSVTAASAFIPS